MRERETCLLVNTSERKKREAGVRERENVSVGNDEKREKAFFLSPSQRSPPALVFPSSQPSRVSTQRDCGRSLRRRELERDLMTVNTLKMVSVKRQVT